MHRGAGTRFVAVSVLHPLSPSYVQQYKEDHAEREQRLIRAREKRKEVKYDELTQQNGADKQSSGERRHKQHSGAGDRPGGQVAPFVFDAFGAWGGAAETLLHWMADAATASLAFDTHAEFVETGFAWISVALQVGNAILVEHTVRQQRVRSSRSMIAFP